MNKPLLDQVISSKVNFVQTCETIGEYYEMNGPYLISYEIFDSEQDFADFFIMGPSFFYREHKIISEDLTKLQNRFIHQHNFFELMFVLKGTVSQRIENHVYEYHAGQCCLLNHNVRHTENYAGNAEIFFLMLSDNFFLQALHNTLMTEYLGKTNSSLDSLFHFIQSSETKTKYFKKQYWDFLPIVPIETIICDFENIFSQIIKETHNITPGFISIIQGLIFRTISILQDPHLYSVRRIKEESMSNESLFIQIYKILDEYHGNISREEISKKLNYNAHYLNRIVKTTTGKSLLEYARMIALKEAAQLLISTNENIDTIVLKLGFTNRSYFYKIFKSNYGLTPKEYRSANKKD